ncbi:GDSL-type esterase/lipase family protein [Cohnella rhizosphaerae]|uniref:GDSL-type esterase/lipase family protein n=1 Tax=Cohnella rhizosphaerae TaxID=1457232 RepID=A0A9X4KXM4_9BACL|nr:GDSL-type esterase/lipase family protein [Cohnella rhizosphaerae]MDG0813045.1 GDSL-type esterase/lipase family protein [Cohnella rhizosphaerae]
MGTACLLCTALLLLGFGWALKDTWAPSSGLALPSPTQAPQQQSGEWASLPEIKAIAIGDSLTRGVGDVAGKGYVADSLAQLSKSMGKPAKLSGNLAVSGLEAAGLDEMLDGKAMRDAVAGADLVLLTIGGNDLFRSSQQTGGSISEGGGIDPELAKRRLPDTLARLEAVFTKLRAINPSVKIAYIALYNPFLRACAAAGADRVHFNGMERLCSQTGRSGRQHRRRADGRFVQVAVSALLVLGPFPPERSGLCPHRASRGAGH